MKKNKNLSNYEAPKAAIVEVKIEKGFAISGASAPDGSMSGEGGIWEEG